MGSAVGGFSNDIVDGQELPVEDLFVGESKRPDAPRLPEPLIAPPVLRGVVVVTVDLYDKFVLGQVEIRDPVVGCVEPLLEPIG